MTPFFSSSQYPSLENLIETIKQERLPSFDKYYINRFPLADISYCNYLFYKKIEKEQIIGIEIAKKDVNNFLPIFSCKPDDCFWGNKIIDWLNTAIEKKYGINNIFQFWIMTNNVVFLFQDWKKNKIELYA